MLFIIYGWFYFNCIYLWGVFEDFIMVSFRILEGSRGVRLVFYVIVEEGFGGFRFVDELLFGVKNGIILVEM